MTITKVTKGIVLLFLLIDVLFFPTIWYFFGGAPAVSFVSGSLVALLNFIFLALIITRVFQKKSVASSFFFIVFKYLAVGLTLYILVANRLVEVPWLLVGLSQLVVAVFGIGFLHIYSFYKKPTKKRLNSENKEE